MVDKAQGVNTGEVVASIPLKSTVGLNPVRRSGSSNVKPAEVKQPKRKAQPAAVIKKKENAAVIKKKEPVEDLTFTLDVKLEEELEEAEKVLGSSKKSVTEFPKREEKKVVAKSAGFFPWVIYKSDIVRVEDPEKEYKFDKESVYVVDITPKHALFQVLLQQLKKESKYEQIEVKSINRDSVLSRIFECIFKDMKGYSPYPETKILVGNEINYVVATKEVIQVKGRQYFVLASVVEEEGTDMFNTTSFMLVSVNIILM